MTKEQKLSGGNISDVYKRGDYVLRNQKENSENVQRLLKHLEMKKIEGVPRFVGIDEQQREVLTYIEGVTADYPLQDYMWTDKALEDVAHLMRKFHDATSDFLANDWEPIINTPLPHEVVCHNDFAVYNTIFYDEKVAGIIDFDLAAPGPRSWDIVYALYTFAPLSARYQAPDGTVIAYDPQKDDERYAKRVRLFLNSYGWTEDHTSLLPVLLLRIEALYLFIEQKASLGDQAFIKMVEEGHNSHYRSEYRFISEHGKKWF